MTVRIMTVRSVAVRSVAMNVAIIVSTAVTTSVKIYMQKVIATSYSPMTVGIRFRPARRTVLLTPITIIATY